MKRRWPPIGQRPRSCRPSTASIRLRSPRRLCGDRHRRCERRTGVGAVTRQRAVAGSDGPTWSADARSSSSAVFEFEVSCPSGTRCGVPERPRQSSDAARIAVSATSSAGDTARSVRRLRVRSRPAESVVPSGDRTGAVEVGLSSDWRLCARHDARGGSTSGLSARALGRRPAAWTSGLRASLPARATRQRAASELPRVSGSALRCRGLILTRD